MIANSHLRSLCFSVLLFSLIPDQSEAAPWQAPPLISGDDAGSALGGGESGRLEFAQTLFTDRKTSLTVWSFREELERGDFSKALAELSRLQIADPQLVVPMANGTWGPLFLNVLRDFDLLPASLQGKLLRESSGAANRRLIEILGQHDVQSLPGFWLRYAGTEEAMQALMLMSRIQIDRGQARSAAVWLRVVVEAGRPKYAAIAQQQLRRLQADDPLNRGVDPKQDAASKAATAADSVNKPASEFPEFASWAFRPAMSPTLEAQIRAFRIAASENLVTPTSSWEPALDKERVYQRTMRGLAAIDLDSGEPLWHYPISPALDQRLLKDRNHANLFARVLENPKAVTSFFSMDQSLFANSFCRDEVQSRPVTSNGRVFLVTTDDGVKLPVSSPRGFFGGPPSTAVPFQLGQLVALDAESGRRIWTVGRATLEQHLGAGDVGVWFYGPPCVTDQAVLSVFEWNGEIRLGRFSVETGQYLSSAPISIPEQTIDKDAIRTLWACTPVRDGGLLWTTTSTGWLLCLDETTLSVVWASRLADESSLRSTSSVRRGRVAALTAQSALNRRWNRSLLKLVGDRILVLSQEAYEAILIDSRTGQRVKTIPVSNAILVHADDDVVVLSDRDSIQCFDLQDGRQLWKHRMHAMEDSESPMIGVKPTGLGAVRGGDLFLPLSNGYLAKLDLESGKVKQGKTRLLPIDGWGHLISASDDRLLYVSAGQVLRLSNTKPKKPVGEYLQLGRELLASGDPGSALREARQVAESDRDFRSAQNLIFQCLLKLARANSENYLDQLKAIQKTEMQQAEQLVLETELLLIDDRPVEAISLICELLKMRTSIIHVPARPVVLEASRSTPDSPSKTKRPTEQIDLTIRTWAMSALTDLLSEVDAEEWPRDDLRSIPQNLLSGIRSPAAVELMTDQVGQSETRQLAFELLQRAVKLKSEIGDAASVDYAGEVKLLDEFLRQIVAVDERDVGVPLDVLRRLISVAIAEMPPSFVAAVRTAGTFEKWSLTWPEQLREQLLQEEREWYAAWDSGDWSAVPIRSRLSYSDVQGVSGRASIADQKDPFLNQYLWRFGAGSPGRFFSSSLTGDVQSDWSLPLGEAIQRSSGWSGWVYRSGTILLLRSNRLLTAVSLLDREVLWSIPVSRLSGSADNRPFQDFLVLGTGRPGTDAAPSWRILSSSDGCICIEEQGECHVHELLTGNLLWKASLSAASFPVVPGPKHTLLFTDSNRTPLLVDVASGQFRAVESLSRKQLSVIHHNDSQIVIWDYQGAEAPRLLWMDPWKASEEERDGQKPAVQKTVALKQFEYFQFLDASTLAAINASGALRIVDLDDGESQDYQVPFSKSEFPASVRQSFLAANNHYLYVGAPEASPNVAHFSSTGRKIEFADELFVLDRKTGTVTAKVAAGKGASLSFQDPRFPMMLVMSQPNRDARRGPLNVRCFGVTGKRLLFKGRFPFDSSVRSLGYSVNRLRSFDLMVNGASFRIEASRSVAASGADQ